MSKRFPWIILAGSVLGCDNTTAGDESMDGVDSTFSDSSSMTTGEVDCADGVCIVSGTIVDDLTMTADVDWLLRGQVIIGNDLDETVLSIEPGTQIFGEPSVRSFVLVTRGSKIMAEGTADAPIVFSSAKNPGSRARGDWGGLIINGRAPLNTCGNDHTGICEAFGEGGTGWYGGDDPADSSGVLNYVRVEFAGELISEDNELNGIAFQGVGSGTEIDFVQVHMNADDGIEFFGGNANVKHVLLTGIGDDSLDWTDGWQGMGQFIIAQQYDDSGDNGIEADNNGDANEAMPTSSPVLSNLTLIGSPASDKSDIGILLREGTGGEIHNTLVLGFNDACLDVDHATTWDNVADGSLVIANSTLDCETSFKANGDNDDEANSVPDFYNEGTGNTEAAVALGAAFDQANPDFAPTGDVSGAVTPADSFFDAVDFKGAVDPSDDWTQGWTTSEPN